jgi:hypothetical protein
MLVDLICPQRNWLPHLFVIGVVKNIVNIPIHHLGNNCYTTGRFVLPISSRCNDANVKLEFLRPFISPFVSYAKQGKLVV